MGLSIVFGYILLSPQGRYYGTVAAVQGQSPPRHVKGYGAIGKVVPSPWRIFKGIYLRNRVRRYISSREQGDHDGRLQMCISSRTRQHES